MTIIATPAVEIFTEVRICFATGAHISGYFNVQFASNLNVKLIMVWLPLLVYLDGTKMIFLNIPHNNLRCPHPLTHHSLSVFASSYTKFCDCTVSPSLMTYWVRTVRFHPWFRTTQVIWQHHHQREPQNSYILIHLGFLALAAEVMKCCTWYSQTGISPSCLEH